MRYVTFLANRYCFEDIAGKHRLCLFALLFIDSSQSDTEVTCGDVDRLAVVGHILKESDECGVWCGASCVQPQLNRTDDVNVMRQGRSRPLQERWGVGFACTRTVETAAQVYICL